MSEVWDPNTEESAPAGFMNEDHDWSATTLLDDGRVFVIPVEHGYNIRTGERDIV